MFLSSSSITENVQFFQTLTLMRWTWKHLAQSFPPGHHSDRQPASLLTLAKRAKKRAIRVRKGVSDIKVNT